MGCISSGPCEPFITEADLCCLEPTGSFPDPCLAGGQAVPQNVIDLAIQAASEVLWAETGRRYGTCTVTIRPCRQDCNPCGFDFYNLDDFLYGFGPAYVPYLSAGVWYNWSPCNCRDFCWCNKAESVELPYPVCSVSEVLIDGAVIPAADYRVDEFRYLIRTDGNTWPRCQSSADLGQPDTFGITLTYGREAPAILKIGTAELACELIKACVGAPCKLSQKVSNIARQGVNMGFIDVGMFFENKLTGIYLVDRAILTLNPNRLTRKPTIYSPDVGPKWRRTNT